MASSNSCWVGVDLGGTTIKFALIDNDGAVLHSNRCKTDADEGYDAPPWARGGWRRDGRGPGPAWRRGGFADRWSDMLAWQLDATAEQAEVFRKEFRSVREELRSLGDERGATLGDLGKALGGERFDAEVMGELFARHDQRLEQLRRALVGALANIHAVLEPAQRERLAKLIGRRGFGFGPYRG